MAICNLCSKLVSNKVTRCPYCTTTFNKSYNQEQKEKDLANMLSLPLCLAACFFIAVAIISLEDGLWSIFDRLGFVLGLTVGGGLFVYLQQWLRYTLSNNGE
jgi:hypothetical protein